MEIVIIFALFTAGVIIYKNVVYGWGGSYMFLQSLRGGQNGFFYAWGGVKEKIKS